MLQKLKPEEVSRPGFGLILVFVISICLLGLSVFYTVELIKLSEDRQKVKYDLALINDVKFGVFNLDVWKDHLARMLNKKIDEFELTTENRLTLEAEIERLLLQLIKEINKVFKKEAYSGENALFKGLLYEIFVDIGEMKGKVPEFADEIMEALDKPKNLAKIKEVLKEKLQEAIIPGPESEDRAALNVLFSRYGCKAVEPCNSLLNKELTLADKEISQTVFKILVPVVLIFILLFFVNGQAKIKIPILVGSCFPLLISGILVPMIEIDARIQSITFQVLGESLEFENQILYYQSKSITEVVELLTRTGKWDLIGVGLLILVFSIFFPCLKLLSTLLLSWFPTALRKNPVSRFLIYRSGKWSLADVLVVALFMAYIGFRGLVDTQFNDLTVSLKGPEVLTTNQTALQAGFTMFFCFCIAGIILSVVVSKDFPERMEEQTEGTS